MIRSILAVCVGYAVTVLLVGMALFAYAIARPQVMEATRPTGGYLIFNLATGAITAVAGGWLTARIAGRKPIAHGIALAIVASLMAVASVALDWGKHPLWYAAILVLGFPSLMVCGSALRR